MEGVPVCRHVCSQMDVTTILSSGSGDGGQPRAKWKEINEKSSIDSLNKDMVVVNIWTENPRGGDKPISQNANLFNKYIQLNDSRLQFSPLASLLY